MSKQNLPVLILNDITVLPSIDIRMDLDRENDKKLIEVSEKYFKGQIILVNKEDPLEENPSFNELLQIGVLANITMKMPLPNQTLRVTVHANKRVEIEKFYIEENSCYAKVKPLLVEEINPKEEMIYLKTLKNLLMEFMEQTGGLGPLNNQIMAINDLENLTDCLAFTFDFSLERKQEYLLECNHLNRAQMLIKDIKSYLEIKELERDIDEKVNYKLEQEQKKYILREKIKTIKEELGENFDENSEILDFRKRLEKLKDNEKIYMRVEKEINRLEGMNSLNPESGVIRNYIELMLSLPWFNETTDEEDFEKIEEILDKNHYGLTKMKDRILDYIALRNRTNQTEGSVLCLVGPPGVGKTTLAKSIAEALNKKYAKISVGGIQDEADIVGHRKTYIGAMPGMIIDGMRKAGVSNPVFIIDEIDKMAKSIHGDPASSLLEALDKEQNNKFVDHYVEEEFDLSKVLFITTANYIGQIPTELLDRLEVIELSSYTEYEKIEILKNYIIPKTIKDYKLEDNHIRFSDDVLLYIIENYTREAGVREIERLIQKILRKHIRDMLDNNKIKLNLTKKNVSLYLGKEIYCYKKQKEKSVVGAVNGLSYTPFGGDTLKIEASKYEGTGHLILTGSLGEVMKESAEVCLSYIKSNRERFGILKETFEQNDFHIHVEEGAIKKEGPSAGIALTTVLLSVLTNTKIPIDVAFTGEMTLRGKILPIGGVREKVIGAHKEKVKKIYLPSYNKRDLEEIPKEVQKDIEFHFVDTYDEIYEELFKSTKNSNVTKFYERIKLEI